MRHYNIKILHIVVCYISLLPRSIWILTALRNKGALHFTEQRLVYQGIGTKERANSGRVNWTGLLLMSVQGCVCFTTNKRNKDLWSRVVSLCSVHRDSPLYNDPPSAYSITRQTWEGRENHQMLDRADDRDTLYWDMPLQERWIINVAAWRVIGQSQLNLLGYCTSRTTLQCWGDSLVKAAGAGDKEETSSACTLFT